MHFFIFGLFQSSMQTYIICIKLHIYYVRMYVVCVCVQCTTAHINGVYVARKSGERESDCKIKTVASCTFVKFNHIRSFQVFFPTFYCEIITFTGEERKNEIR